MAGEALTRDEGRGGSEEVWGELVPVFPSSRGLMFPVYLLSD